MLNTCRGRTVTPLLDVSFNWFILHTIGVSLAAILVGVMLAHHEYRTQVLLLLTLSADSYIALDVFL